MSGSYFIRETRRLRKERRADLRNRGIRPTRSNFVYRVDVDKAAIPGWARENADPRFSQSPDHFWTLKRFIARKVSELDQELGGLGEITKVEYRVCGLCHRVLLNLEAERRREQIESCVTGKQHPCGPGCLEKHWQDKGEQNSCTTRMTRTRLAQWPL